MSKRLTKKEQDELTQIVKFEQVQAQKVVEAQTMQFFVTQYKNNWLNNKLKELGLDSNKQYKLGDDGEFILQKEDPSKNIAEQIAKVGEVKKKSPKKKS